MSKTSRTGSGIRRTRVRSLRRRTARWARPRVPRRALRRPPRGASESAHESSLRGGSAACRRRGRRGRCRADDKESLDDPGTMRRGEPTRRDPPGRDFEHVAGGLAIGLGPVAMPRKRPNELTSVRSRSTATPLRCQQSPSPGACQRRTTRPLASTRGRVPERRDADEKLTVPRARGRRGVPPR